MAQKPQNVKGMIDHLPASQLLRQHIITTLTGVFERYGFEPMSTPAVEYAETLEGKIGFEEKLIYRVEHSGGGDKRMVLRYDQTVPLARVIAQYQGKIVLPLRRYAIGPSYRGENTQKGRYREFTQADIDIVGSSSPLADAEVVAVASQALSALGFKGFRILINHRELLSSVVRSTGLDAASAGLVFRAIDKLDKIGRGGVRQDLVQGGVGEEIADQILETVLIEGTPEVVLARLNEKLGTDPQALTAVENLRQIQGYLQAMGMPDESYALAPSLARGLDYYTGMVFEAVMVNPSMKGSLLGGGRYDELIGQFSGQRTPTVGMAMGVERLAAVLEELGLASQRRTTSELLVTVTSTEQAPAALALAAKLRSEGINVEIALDPKQSLGRQFQFAEKKGIPLALILSSSENGQDQVQIKRLATGDQQIVAHDDLLETIRALLRQP